MWERVPLKGNAPADVHMVPCNSRSRGREHQTVNVQRAGQCSRGGGSPAVHCLGRPLCRPGEGTEPVPIRPASLHWCAWLQSILGWVALWSDLIHATAHTLEVTHVFSHLFLSFLLFFLWGNLHCSVLYVEIPQNKNWLFKVGTYIGEKHIIWVLF